jgi:hypothetical protein
MTTIRTILALAIILSLAILPASAGFVVEKSTAASSTIPCDHDHGGSHPADHKGPIHKAVRDCVACAIHCFGMIGPVVSNLPVPLSPLAIEPSFSPQDFLGQVGHPPFRPPRA